MKIQHVIDLLCSELVADVVARNQAAMDYCDNRRAFWQDKPVERLEERLKALFDETRAYRQFAPTDLTHSNDYAHFMQTISKRALQFDKVASAGYEFQLLQEERDDLLGSHPDRVAQIEKIYCAKAHRIFTKLFTPRQQQEMKHNILRELVSRKEMEQHLLQQVTTEYAPHVFDGKRDRGNCTKSLTVSLYKLQKKYGIQLFPSHFDFENIIHPQELQSYFAKYATPLHFRNG